MAATAVILAAQRRIRFNSYTFPPNILWLLAYLAFAGASVLWALDPSRSLVRYTQQVMVITSVILPSMLARQTVDLTRNMFLCFAAASVLNVFFVWNESKQTAIYGSTLVAIGYQGYFLGKNYLGECSAFTLLLAFNEILRPRWRRALGIAVSAIAASLVFLSDSKTALGLAIICPLLAAITLTARKMTRASPAIVLSSIPLLYTVLSSVSNFNANRLSFIIYGDSTLTGRTIIWDFVRYEIDRHPWTGWGYQSFWFVPSSPAFTEAPGWVKLMPNAHNGYYDTRLEMGYVGLVLLLIFILATLHVIGRIADRDPIRAQALLSLALYIICFNFLESLWMRGFEFLWVAFLIVAADVARYARPISVRRVKGPKAAPETVSSAPFVGGQQKPSTYEDRCNMALKT